MLEERLRPYLVGFVNGHYAELDDQLVFAYNEAHAIETILKTYNDANLFMSRNLWNIKAVSFTNIGFLD